MSIHVVDTLCISSYDEQVQGSIRVLKEPHAALENGGEGWLLIDDLVDTGTTMKAARDILPNALLPRFMPSLKVCSSSTPTCMT